MPALESIRLRGVRQNNLKGFDLDIPLGRYVVVTGLSGAGKSSLVFDTLHAEGQRRYVETFSAYTRQFLELLAKPQVDSIENIRPSIAIEQTNTVKTSRSTVGTMTELCDYFKVWFSHVAACYDPATGERVDDDNPQTIWAKTAAQFAGQTVLEAAEEVGVPIEYACRQGYCGICKVKLLSGEVTMAVDDSLTPLDRSSGMILACQAKASADISVDA